MLSTGDLIDTKEIVNVDVNINVDVDIVNKNVNKIKSLRKSNPKNVLIGYLNINSIRNK